MSQAMKNFIGFARFIVYDDEDTSFLFLEKKKHMDNFLLEQKKKGVDIDKKENVDKVQ